MFDTMIFVRALMNPCGRWGRLVVDRIDEYGLIVSEQVLAEVVEVLHRPELTRRYPALGGRDLISLLALLARAEVVVVQSIPPIPRDPKDDKLLATAKAAGADFLVTEDNDLLVLQEYEGARINTALEFLRVLDAWAAGEPLLGE